MKSKLSFSSLVAVCLLALIGCGLKVGNLDVGKLASTSANVLSGNQLSNQQQLSIGRDMAAIIVGSSELHKNAELQKYVNRVGTWVAMQSDVSTQKNIAAEWRFIVIDTPDFNAFSMPGGYIVISSGVIDRLSSEAELAAVLAHEIVHVEQKHQVKAIEKSNRLADLGSLAFTAADYQQSKSGGYDANSLRNRQVAKGLFDITQTIYTKGLGRDDELDADQKAVILMTRAGYDPFAYLTVLQLVESIDSDKKLLLLATHPKTQERIHVAYQSVQKVSRYARLTKTVENRFIDNVP